MASAFLFSFAVGIFFTLVSGLLQASHGHLDGGAASGKIAAPEGAETPGGKFAWPSINLSAWMMFLTWFGAAGLITLKVTTWGTLPALLVAIACGLPAHVLVTKFFALLRSPPPAAALPAPRLEGQVARVTVGTSGEEVGEIVFILNGVQRIEGARSADGRPIAQGSHVWIVDYQNGVALVEPAPELQASPPEPPPS
ncbi:MAG: hypothetical protein VKP62_02325 [Candidatus Sericytochromatia bacterium]|nr:hypothetical protein [Candidatus Sericytochromatia bacterium]